MMDGISFDVLGIPVPKGSVTVGRYGGLLQGKSPAARARYDEWKYQCEYEARFAMAGCEPLCGPVAVFMAFRLPVPVSMSKRDRHGIRHTKKPDLDKLWRMVGDCLTGICYDDDSQVCLSTTTKRYAWNNVLGASITVIEWPIGSELNLPDVTGLALS